MRQLTLILLLLLSLLSCHTGSEELLVSQLHEGEWMLITSTAGHMLPPNSSPADGLSYAYRIEGGSSFQVYEHDPKAANVLEAVQASAEIPKDSLAALDELLRFYRWPDRPEGCDWSEWVEVTWHLRDRRQRETFMDRSCVLEVPFVEPGAMEERYRFREHPLMPVLRAAGWRP